MQLYSSWEADSRLADQEIPQFVWNQNVPHCATFEFLKATSMKMTVFWDIAPCSLGETERWWIALMMEAVSTSETSVNFSQTTRHIIPEDGHLRSSLCSQKP
jgi:hypothetical protein